MRVPGFTAEISLARTDERYVMAWAGDQAGVSVRPASCIGECFQECIAWPPGPSKAGCMAMCRRLCRLGLE
jgi:hypothetical protein